MYLNKVYYFFYNMAYYILCSLVLLASSLVTNISSGEKDTTLKRDDIGTLVNRYFFSISKEVRLNPPDNDVGILKNKFPRSTVRTIFWYQCIFREHRQLIIFVDLVSSISLCNFEVLSRLKDRFLIICLLSREQVYRCEGSRVTKYPVYKDLVNYTSPMVRLLSRTFHFLLYVFFELYWLRIPYFKVYLYLFKSYLGTCDCLIIYIIGYKVYSKNHLHYFNSTISSSSSKIIIFWTAYHSYGLFVLFPPGLYELHLYKTLNAGRHLYA